MPRADVKSLGRRRGRGPRPERPRRRRPPTHRATRSERYPPRCRPLEHGNANRDLRPRPRGTRDALVATRRVPKMTCGSRGLGRAGDSGQHDRVDPRVERLTDADPLSRLDQRNVGGSVRLERLGLGAEPDLRPARRVGRAPPSLGLDVLARSRMKIVPTTEPEIGADDLPALTAHTHQEGERSATPLPGA